MVTSGPGRAAEDVHLALGIDHGQRAARARTTSACATSGNMSVLRLQGRARHLTREHGPTRRCRCRHPRMRAISGAMSGPTIRCGAGCRRVLRSVRALQRASSPAQYTAGMTTSVSTVDDSMPPIMGTRDTLHDLGAGAAAPKDRQQAGDDGGDRHHLRRRRSTAPLMTALLTSATVGARPSAALVRRRSASAASR